MATPPRVVLVTVVPVVVICPVVIEASPATESRVIITSFVPSVRVIVVVVVVAATVTTGPVAASTPVIIVTAAVTCVTHISRVIIII